MIITTDDGHVEYRVGNRTRIRIWAKDDVVLEIGDNGDDDIFYFTSLDEVRQLAEDIQSILSEIEK